MVASEMLRPEARLLPGQGSTPLAARVQPKKYRTAGDSLLEGFYVPETNLVH